MFASLFGWLNPDSSIRRLRHRYGCPPPRSYINELKSRNYSALCIFNAVTPLRPHCYWVCCTIDIGESSGSVESRSSEGIIAIRKQGDEEKIAVQKSAMEAEEIREILGLIREAEAASPFHNPPFVRDGLKASLLLLSTATSKSLKVECNFAGLPKNYENDPRIKLMRKMHSFGMLHNSSPQASR